MTDKLVLFMYESWAQLDRAVEGLAPSDAEARHEGASRIAWTVGHVTHMVDSWLNVKFQGLSPHPLFGDATFRSGASGDAPPWPEVVAAVEDVRQSARRLFDSEPGPSLDDRVPYDGSIPALRSAGLSLRYALMRISAHHFIHTGEIDTIRARLGHSQPATSPDWAPNLM
jgi:uncharacterized protein DUF664